MLCCDTDTAALFTNFKGLKKGKWGWGAGDGLIRGGSPIENSSIGEKMRVIPFLLAVAWPKE